MAIARSAQPRQRLVMARLRSALVSYLALSGELARQGYVQLPEAERLPPLDTPEEWSDALDDFNARIRRQEAALASAASHEDRLSIVATALATAIRKVRSDASWADEYRAAGATQDEQDFARTAPTRLRDAS